MRGRGLVIAAPASGSGKTVLALGLLRHLARRGLRVVAAKAGPDYIDPSFHQAAGGLASVNLDPWAMRRETLAGLVAGLGEAGEIVICEGAMGLFDGAGASGEDGSSAALARLTGWPVVLVVDGRGQGASAAALIRGFAGHDPALPLAGVIFNRVSGERHRALLTGALARHLPDLPCLGAVPADSALMLPSRHLGLVPAGESERTEEVVSRAAEAVGAFVDVERLLALARSSQLEVPAAPATGGIAPLGRRIAVARDAAFAFAYPTLLEGWRRRGAEVAFFSPLADEPPPPAAEAIYLPGGYPELWAERLAGADAFLAGLRRAAAAGKPVYGECGGYMVLGESLIDGDGRCHRMAGLLPLETSFAERRLHLGYRAARLLAHGPLGAAGARFRGHEFHYASVLREGRAAPLFAAADAAGRDVGACGARCGTVCGSFLHLIDTECVRR